MNSAIGRNGKVSFAHMLHVQSPEGLTNREKIENGTHGEGAL